MGKRIVSINSVEDAIDRMTTPKAGDHIIVRGVSITVPSPSYDLSITNATMQMLIDNFNDPNAASKYELTTLDDGQYEIMAVFHLRRVGKPEKPVLN